VSRLALLDVKRGRLFFVLFKLAEIGALGKPVRVPTKALAEELKCSQQAISRYLIALERLGLVERHLTERGGIVKVTEAGHEELKTVCSKLHSLIETPLPPISIKGEVFTGLKEGAYYVSLNGYRKQFTQKLKFDPYPGTLNLKLKSREVIESRRKLAAYPALEIKGFGCKLRTYGPVKCYRAIINDKVEGAVVMALRTHYDDSVLELIAPVNLREHFKLKDGDEVHVMAFAS
jgi:riboflavin kinase